MKAFFRDHGKWAFVPAPAFILAGAVLGVTGLVYVGIGLLGALVLILVVGLTTKYTLIR